jgi:hypothetical protein
MKTDSLEKANEILRKNHALVVIGFDVLQVPRYRIVFKHRQNGR